MAYREVSVIEIRELLRLWLLGEGLRAIARLTPQDRKTVRRYVEAAQVAGLRREGGEEQLTDELLGAVRPVRARPAAVLRLRTRHRGRFLPTPTETNHHDHEEEALILAALAFITTVPRPDTATTRSLALGNHPVPSRWQATPARNHGSGCLVSALPSALGRRFSTDRSPSKARGEVLVVHDDAVAIDGHPDAVV